MNSTFSIVWNSLSPVKKIKLFFIEQIYPIQSAYDKFFFLLFFLNFIASFKISSLISIELFLYLLHIFSAVSSEA